MKGALDFSIKATAIVWAVLMFCVVMFTPEYMSPLIAMKTVIGGVVLLAGLALGRLFLYGV